MSASVSVTKMSSPAGVRYLVRWRAPAGPGRTAHPSKTFKRKTDADRFATQMSHDLLTGAYVDPRAGDTPLRDYAARWLDAQTFNPSSREGTEQRLRLHVYPYIGSMPLSAIQPSTVQGLMKRLQETLSASSAGLVFANVSSILASAVDDNLIYRNPCSAKSVSRPRTKGARAARVWSLDVVEDVHDALPEPMRIFVRLASGLGLRQGEVLGLSPDDVDFLRGFVTVRRQVKIIKSQLVFALPKGDKERTIPLPSSVRDDLAAHLAAFPAQSVTLPWYDVTGTPTTVSLVMSRNGSAVDRNYFNKLWRPAYVSCKQTPCRENGTHILRHTYASVLIDAGESIKVVADRLGHSDPGFTLRVYAHLMPHSDERTRVAVDQAFAAIKINRSVQPMFIGTPSEG